MHRKLILRHRAGLTLMEIMIVIAILVVLTAVLGSGLTQYLHIADVNMTKMIIGKTEGGITLYQATHRRVPESLGRTAAMDSLQTSPASSLRTDGQTRLQRCPSRGP